MSFGLGDVLVARSADHVHRFDIPQTEGHHRQSLDPTEYENPVGTGFVHGVDRGWVKSFALDRWRAGHNGFDPGHFCRNDAHLGRTEHRISAPGYIAARRVHRDVPMPQNDSRFDFDLQRPERFHLRLGELSHVLLAEVSVLDDLGGKP